jgi:hypothetical protein
VVSGKPPEKKPKVEIQKPKRPTPNIPAFEPQKQAEQAFAPQQSKNVNSPAANPDNDLTEDEREDIELARWADRNHPGTEKKMRDFIAKRRLFISEKVKEEGRDYRPSRDHDYREWLEENNPLPANQRRKWERQKDREDLKHEFEQGRSKTEAQLKRELEALRLKPEIEKKRTKFRDDLEAALPVTLKEIFPEIEAADEAVSEMRPMLEPIAERYASLAETFLMLNSGAESYDYRNGSHAFISEFIDGQARYFETHAAVENLFRDGKRFVRPDVMPQVPKDQAHKYWTFTEQDIVDVLSEKSKMETRKTLQEKRMEWERFQKFNRKPETPDGKSKPNGDTRKRVADKMKNKPPEDLGVSAETSQSPGAAGVSEHQAEVPSFLGLLNDIGR